MDQPGKVGNPARGQLNKEENGDFRVPVRASESGFARRVRSSRPASACSFSTLRLNPVLTHGVSPDFRGGVSLIYTAIHTPSGQPRVYRATQFRTMAFTAKSPLAQGQ